jgi:hypothetical protein
MSKSTYKRSMLIPSESFGWLDGILVDGGVAAEALWRSPPSQITANFRSSIVRHNATKATFSSFAIFPSLFVDFLSRPLFVYIIPSTLLGNRLIHTTMEKPSERRRLGRGHA